MDCLSPILDIGTRLWDCSYKHVAYIHNLEDNMQKLRAETDTLRCRHQDMRLRVEEAEQQPRMKRTEDAELWMTLAETMVSEVNSIIEKGREEVQKKCVGDCCPKNLKSTYKIGKKVIKKIDSVIELLCKAEHFYSDSAIFFRLPRKRLLMPEWPLGHTVGLNPTVEKVWRAIEDENVRIIRVCGQGGVGKTTLLKKVCNEFHGRSHDFDVVIWVKVPREEDYIEKVQEVIRKKLDIPDDIWNQCSDEDEKGAWIFSVLKLKKFVLLLDDVWEQFDLLTLGIQLRDDQTHSKVIFTACSLRLYLNFDIKAQVTIEVKCLPPEQALSLFRMALGEHVESVLSSDLDLLELANMFARKCRGLPLAILTFAGAIACLESPWEWRHTIELSHSQPSEIARMGGHVFPLLKFSYDNLKEAKDQNCFLYCSLFPEDYSIRINELIDLWVGEGFLDGLKPCDQGALTIGTLKSVYLLETDESKQCVRMHDIIRHMALWLARDEGRKKNKILVSKNGWLTDQELTKWEEANWISLFGCISTKVNISRSPSCPYLTTLLLRDGQLESFPDGFFDSMPTLKVLDLSGNWNLVDLPSNIGNAKTLQYLNLSFTSLARLPIGLGYLRNLKCLLLDYTMNLKCISKEVISNLLLLQVYSKVNGINEYFGSGKSVPYDEVDFLEVLENLSHLNKVGITIFSAPSLGKMMQSHTLRSCIRKLTIMECNDLISLHFTEEVSNLERLDIYRCNLVKEFKVSEQCKLGNLSMVYIGFCPMLLNLNSIAYARNLESLTIFDCESLKEVISEEMELPGLKSISLTRLQILKRICPSSRCFPSLLEIELCECPSLRQLPFDLESTNFLQKIVGETKWWDDLIWDDEVVKDACSLKFASTSFEVLQNLNPYPPLPSLPSPPQRCKEYVDSQLDLEDKDSELNLEDMNVIRVIGKGYGTIVQLVQHKETDQFFALKIIEMDMEKSVQGKIAKKLRLIQYSQCPHVVVHYDSFYSNGSISIMLEYMDGGSLADLLKTVKSIPEPCLAAICKQALKGLIYLHHELQVIHRDIKTSTLLINHKGEVKITDFVESAELISSSGRANTFVGTYNYMSPERIVGDNYGIDTDIWSLGIVLLECATGKFPYPPPEQAEEWTNFYELMECIIEGPAPYAPSDQFSPQFCSFISACLRKDPKERKSAEELLELPFITRYDDLEMDLSSYFSGARLPVSIP